MAKSKISYKKTTDRVLSLEGSLVIDNLPDGAILLDVEEEGLIDVKKYLTEFVDCNIKIRISDTVKEDIE